MPDPTLPLSLAVGDRVVYPNQGVCRVSGVEAKEVAGQTLTFVTMRREEDGAVVMVPEAKVRAIGLRKVATRDEVDHVFAFLRADTDKAVLDWKARARTNVERMSQGGILGLAEVVKGLQVLSELRPLPTKERELYDNARHLLVAELSASLTTAPCNAEDAVDLVLFPPGRERPKRTAEEFKRTVTADDEELGDLGDELLALGGDLELAQEEEPAAEAAEPEAPEPEEKAAPPRKARAKPAAAAVKTPKRGVAKKPPAKSAKKPSKAAPRKPAPRPARKPAKAAARKPKKRK